MLESGCVLAKIKLRDARHNLVTCVMILMFRFVTNRYVNVRWVGTTRFLLDSDLSGSVVPTSSRHVITHELTKGNSIGVENRIV